MPETVSGFEFSERFLNALGISNERVANIYLDILPGGPVIVTIERVLYDDDADKVVDLVKEYKLVKVSDGD